MTPFTLRRIIGGLFLLLAPVISHAQELKVTLLGTGSPPPEIERFGPGRPSENVLRFAQRADVMIHEVIAARAGVLRESERVRQTVSIHTTPEEAGKIFDRVKPKLAVYTHVGLVGGPVGRAALAGELVPRTRSTYAGRLEVGEDLMTIVIGDRVNVRRTTTPVR